MTDPHLIQKIASLRTLEELEGWRTAARKRGMWIGEAAALIKREVEIKRGIGP